MAYNRRLPGNVYNQLSRIGWKPPGTQTTVQNQTLQGPSWKDFMGSPSQTRQVPQDVVDRVRGGGDDGGGGGGTGPFGGNDIAWLYDALMKQFGNAGDTGMFSGLGPRNLLAGGQYKDQLMNSIIPQLIQQYGSGAYTSAGGSAPAGTSASQVPGWLASKIGEQPEEAYWRLRKALGLAPLHG